MGEHAAHRTRGQELVRDTAKNPFPQSAVSIATGDNEIGILILNKAQELGCDRSPGRPPDFISYDDLVAD